MRYIRALSSEGSTLRVSCSPPSPGGDVGGGGGADFQLKETGILFGNFEIGKEIPKSFFVGVACHPS